MHDFVSRVIDFVISGSSGKYIKGFLYKGSLALGVYLLLCTDGFTLCSQLFMYNIVAHQILSYNHFVIGV